MSITMHSSSVPVFVRMLKNLSAILDKADQHAEARKFDRRAPAPYPVPDLAVEVARRLPGGLVAQASRSFAHCTSSFRVLRVRASGLPTRRVQPM